MTHEHSKHGREHHGNQPGRKRPIHHDWRLWTVVILMLVAMGIYVMSMDDSLRPGGKQGEPMPAAPAAP